MKKILAPGLALLLGALTACGNMAFQPPQEPLALQSSPSGEPIVIRYELRETVLRDSAADQDGTGLASYSYSLPTLAAVREDGTDITEPANGAEEAAFAKAETFNNRFDQWAEDNDFASTVQMAEEDRALRKESGTEWAEPYTEELTYSAWQTDHLVSIRGEYYSYTGGAHPNTVLLGWNYDLDAGAFITPMVLAEDEQTFLNAVTEEIIRQANVPLKDGTIPAAGYWEDYQNIAAEWTNYAVSFDDSGMTVEFSPYELAAYAAGCQAFFLSYEFLDPYLSNAGRQLLGLKADS